MTYVPEGITAWLFRGHLYGLRLVILNGRWEYVPSTHLNNTLVEATLAMSNLGEALKATAVTLTDFT